MIALLVISICLNIFFVVVNRLIIRERTIGMMVIDVFEGNLTPYLIVKDGDTLSNLKQNETVCLKVRFETEGL